MTSRHAPQTTTHDTAPMSHACAAARASTTTPTRANARASQRHRASRRASRGARVSASAALRAHFIAARSSSSNAPPTPPSATPEDIDAGDFLSALESFHEDEVQRFEVALKAEDPGVFKGTMDEGDGGGATTGASRVDKLRAERREKRTAVRRAQGDARRASIKANGGGAKSDKLGFLYEEGVDVASEDTVTKCNDAVRLCTSMEEVLMLVKEMRDCGVEPVESTYVAVMLVCRNVGAPERAVQVYDALADAGVSVSSRTFYLAIELALKAGMIRDALRVKDDMQYKMVPIGSRLYVTLLRAVADNDIGKRKGPQERLVRTCRLFEEMLADGVTPPPAAYHILILAAYRAKQYDLAVRTFEEFVDTGVTPSRQTYETVIDAMSKSGLVPQALEVFVSMKKAGLAPRKQSYNALLAACVNAPQPRVEAAFEIFSELRESGDVEPDKNTFALLIDAASKAGRPELAFDAFTQMRESGLEVEISTLNRLIHATGLNAKEDETAVQAGLELYNAMGKLGVQPDVITYGSLISTCAKSRDGKTAIRLFNEMESNGIEPNTIVFNVLINALGRADCGDKAMEYFKMMQERAMSNRDLIPNRETYTTIFDAVLGPGGAESAVAKHALESGDGESFVHSSKVSMLRGIYANGVESGVYEDLSTSLSLRDPEAGACTINMNQLSRTEAVVATFVFLQRLSELKVEDLPSALFIYAGKASRKGGAQRRLLAIETVLRAADIKFQTGDVGAANIVAIKGKHATRWVEKNAGTF